MFYMGCTYQSTKAKKSVASILDQREYNIDHISEEKLECIGQLLDVMDVVEDTAQLYNTNASTNDETDDEQTQTE